MHVLRFLSWELSDLLMFMLVVLLHSGSILDNRDTSKPPSFSWFYPLLLVGSFKHQGILAKFSGWVTYHLGQLSNRGYVKKLEMDFICEGRWNCKQVNHNLYERVDVLLSNYMFTCRNFVSISSIIFLTAIHLS